MKAFHHTIITLLPLVLISCQVGDVVEGLDSTQVFYATGEINTRTQLNEPSDWTWNNNPGRYVLWNPSDEINVFCQTGGGRFVSTNTEETSGTVEFIGSLSGVKDRKKTDLYWAVYPYSEDNSFDGHSVGVSLPAEQCARLDNVERGLLISMARSDNNNLYFRNLCGVISIPIYEKGVKKIVFKGNNDESLAGKVKASFDESGCPVVSEWIDPVKEITLLPKDGESFVSDSLYNVVCFPTYFEKGYTIEFYRDELVSIKQIHTPVTLSRAGFVNLFKLYTGGTIASEEYEGTTYSLEYAWKENEGVRYWVKIGEKTFEIPGLFNVLPDENPTRMGPAVAINTDTQVIYFAMANVSNRHYNFDTGVVESYVFDKAYIYRITASGIEETEQEIGLYPLFRLNEQRYSLELHSYKHTHNEDTYQHCFLEKMSNNHWASVSWLFGDPNGDSSVDYSSSGFNTKTLSDIIFLYQEEFPQISLDMNAVDLGLSVNWGSCNLGASAPEQYGGQYAWGETETKDSFTPDNYKFGGSHSNPYSYWDFVGCSKYNEEDMKYFLDSGDDAAHVKLGEDWRIPSPKEWQELMDNCVWKWTSVHDIIGVVGTSKINGKCIFFPMNYTSGEDWLESGIYHSSQVVSVENYEFAYAGYYYDYGQAIDVLFSYYVEAGIKNVLEFTTPVRYEGAAIRPVYGHIAVEDIALDTPLLDLSLGESYQLTALFSPTNATNLNVTWSSSDDSAIRVSQSGVVTCVAEGKAMITVTTQEGRKSASCLVNRDYCPTPEIVDLGLSVKWASFNLGAKKPEEVGNYYSWGETKTKDLFNYSTYKWCAKEPLSGLTKYCYDPDYGFNGFTDNRTVLEPSDDAASVNLGGKWRMPTSQEIEELYEGCECSSAFLNNVEGKWVTSRVNGNRIFFPLSGELSDDVCYNPECGYYWSSSLYTYGNFTTSAYSLMLYPDTWGLWDSFRTDGLPIRPVYDDSDSNGGNEGITPGDDINM